ncbi:MAG: diguanylate cyclase [Fuerstiella sp.]
MFQDGWEETITANTVLRAADAGEGCLLQIHPLAVSGNLIELVQAETTIGREVTCGLCLPDSSVSRRHALIERIDDQYQITDLGSTNGICVNECRLQSAVLSPGDRIQIGGFIFKFLSTNHIETQYHEAVYSMMTRDGLTGTLNKRSFLDIIGREFHRAVHRHVPLSLILFDIDHFKSVNDTHGHLAGDEVLQEIGHRIGGCVAEHDVFARYGGEEFAILLAGVPLAEACLLAETCRSEVERKAFTTCCGELPITISVGVADMTQLPQHDAASQLVQAADMKLYEAKHGGRNRVCS